MNVLGTHYRTVWMEGRAVHLIDQRVLPHQFHIVESPDHRSTAAAIRNMTVRGAPAIGATAAYAMAQVYLEAPDGEGRQAYIEDGFQRLRMTRPTAQNLFYALDRVRRAAEDAPLPKQPEAALAEARLLADQDVAACRAIGEHGAPLIRAGMRVLTHCNAGWLACVDWGTALAPIYLAHRRGRTAHVLADETRPRCQGASLTAWELMHEDIPVEVIADNAAGFLICRGEVDLVITGADRIAANGDVANKIGTYEKALLAREHQVPFYVAAPLSTFDKACVNGNAIPIEERDPDEVLYATGLHETGRIERVRLSPEGVLARNPAFDVTPASLIRGLVTEKGILEPTPQALANVLA